MAFSLEQEIDHYANYNMYYNISITTLVSLNVDLYEWPFFFFFFFFGGGGGGGGGYCGIIVLITLWNIHYTS